MAFVQIAATETYEYEVGADTFSYSHVLEQDGGSLNTSRKLNYVGYSAQNTLGQKGAHPLAPIQPRTMRLSIRDDGRAFATLFKASPASSFRLTSTRNGLGWFKGLLQTVTGGDRLLQDRQTVSLLFNDGTPLLRTLTYDLEGYYTVAELFYQILSQTTVDLPLRVYFDWSHNGYDTTLAKALAHRIPAAYLVRDAEDATYYDALERLCADFNLQYLQSRGYHRVMQRDYRGGVMSYVEVSTAGVTSTGSEDLRLALTEPADGGGRFFQGRDRVSIVAFKAKRLFAQEGTLNSDFEDGSLADGYEHWTGTGGYGDEGPILEAGETLEQQLTTVFQAVNPGDNDAARVILSGRVLEDGTSAPSDEDVKLCQVWLTYPDGSKRYADGGGAWQTDPATHVTETISLPGTAGTYTTFSVNLELDPIPDLSQGGALMTIKLVQDPLAGRLVLTQFYEASVDPILNVEPTGGLTYISGSGKPEEHTSVLGDYRDENQTAGVMQYYDGANWQNTEDWDGTGLRFHTKRIQDRYSQLSGRLAGIEAHIALVAGNDIEAHHTATYGGVSYVPVFTEESDHPFVREIEAYPILDETPAAVDIIPGTSGSLSGSTSSGSSGGSGGGASGTVAWDFVTGKPAIVNTFNTRSGAVTLSDTDVTDALGFTPISQADVDALYVNVDGDTMTGDLVMASGTLKVDTDHIILDADGGSPGYVKLSSGRIGQQIGAGGTFQPFARTNAAETISQTWTFQPAVGSGSKVFDFNHAYALWVDNTGAGSHLSRWWLDGPDGGEAVIGPRSGSSWFDQIRMRARDYDIEVNGGVFSVDGKIGGPAFASGFTGSGWQIDPSVDGGHAEFGSLVVRGRMSIYELLINQINVTNGSRLATGGMKIDTVSSSGLPAGQYRVAPAAGLYFPFLVNDLVQARQWDRTGTLVLVYGRVISVDPGNAYGIIELGSSSDVPVPGLTLARYGNTTDTSRQGGIYETTDDSFAPYIDVYDGLTNVEDYANLGGSGRLKARYGRLDGITDADFGTLIGYGLYSENAYLKGVLKVLEGSDIAGWLTTDTRFHKTLDVVGTGYTIDLYTEFNGSERPMIRVGWGGLGADGVTEYGPTQGSNYITIGAQSFLASGGIGRFSSGFDTTGGGIAVNAGGRGIFFAGFRDGEAGGAIAGADFDFQSVWAGGTKGNAGWQWNDDGSGYAAGGNITWDAAGNATYQGSITASTITGTVSVSGGEIVAGNGNVKLDVSGLWLNAEASERQIRWADSTGAITRAYIQADSNGDAIFNGRNNILASQGGFSTIIRNGSNDVILDANGFRLEDAVPLVLMDRTTDPAAVAGASIVYSKAGKLYTRRSDGVVTQLS